jgi:hypothetical protein
MELRTQAANYANDRGASARPRLRAYVVSALVLGSMALPVLRQPDDDGFPLSTYPMFSHRRGRVNSVTSALAVSADAHETRVPPRYVANAESMQAFYTLARAAAAGADEAKALCEAIAQRLPSADDRALAQAVRVELVTERVDAIDYLAGRVKPSGRLVHASCPVSQPEAP